ncbi:MAG: metal-dependent hydrolase, beta-lactamase superfamily [Planctomycetota bacterium]|nr:metal-dependent hydrolase, beta-lactamase superfamily [Planctomycetota bacterium]
MSVDFTVLASGSRGNAALIRSGGVGLLIDLGLGPRVMAARMSEVSAGWAGVASALLTHTHGDHVQSASLKMLASHGIPLYCHEGHRAELSRHAGFKYLERADCVRSFDERPFLTPDGKRIEPIVLSHDGGPTFGFRIEARSSRRGRPVAIGYLADTGCWTRATADCLTDVNVLGVEFNHDVEMQRRSGRAPYLIARNLGNRGHLSNDQGAGLVSAVLERSARRTVRHVVLLHLSQQCNLPALAINAAKAAVRDRGASARIHAASQWIPHPHLPVTPSRRQPTVATAFPWESDADEVPFRLTVE